MKRWIWIPVLLCLLTGCAAEETFETVADVWAEPTLPQPRSISVVLPGETAMPAMESSSGRVYLSSDYEIYLQTMAGGDLNATVEAMSGFSPEKLTMLTTEQDGSKRHEFVWAAAGEGGDFLGRGIILDDGNYHYTMTVLRSAQEAESSTVVWDGVFSSFRLV